MKRIIKMLVAAVLVLSLAASPIGNVQAAKTKTYKNKRFHYTMKYPKYFKVVNKSQNGDGITLNGKGASLAMYGSTPFKKMTGKKYKKLYKSYGMKMKKTKATKYGFYYEEEHVTDTTIYYICYSKKFKVEAGFYITCPKGKVKSFRKVAKSIKKSLKFKK